MGAHIFWLFMSLSFVGMVAMPYTVDYVYFYWQDNMSWLEASVTAATITMAMVMLITYAIWLWL